MTSEKIVERFGNRLRVRVNGLLIENNCLLLIKHKGLGDLGFLWAPPGGELEFGTSAPQNLKREFFEETGLEVEIKEFLFTCELVHPPLHAVEMFFLVKKSGGLLSKGRDPELGTDQIIEAVKFLSIEEIKQMPPPALHKIFQNIENFQDLLKKHGYYSI